MGKLWKDEFAGSEVVGLTNTTANHEKLKAMGLRPATKDDGGLAPGQKFANVLFSAPPSGSADYASEVRGALDRWDGTGSFVFTSSMSICAAENGEMVTEDSCGLVTEGKAPSTDRLLAAENLVLKAGGNVIRYVGLYHASRGAHTFFLKAKEVPRWGGYTVNLLHYEDAARLAKSVVSGEGSGPFRGQVFIGCDNHPVTFQDMMTACTASNVPSLQGEVRWTLPESESTKGKKVSNPKTREILGGWKPKYDSFEQFVKVNGAKDIYN